MARPAWTSQPLSTSASVSGEHRNISEDEKISSETKQYALAAVILEEWLHELAAIATEQVWPQEGYFSLTTKIFSNFLDLVT